MDSEGSEEVNLTDDPAWDRDPSWFPSGDRIAYVSDRTTDGSGTEVEIYALQVGSSGDTQPVRITNTPSYRESGPVISPDGKQIAFVSYADIYVMNADGTDQTRITTNPAQDSYPAFSPNGKYIAFSSDRGNADGSSGPDIWKMKSDGSNPTQLTDDPAHNVGPNWQPLP
jgi:Tol biopolymer transport system component